MELLREIALCAGFAVLSFVVLAALSLFFKAEGPSPWETGHPGL